MINFNLEQIGKQLQSRKMVFSFSENINITIKLVIIFIFGFFYLVESFILLNN